jgi:hypothetical protein
MVLFAAPKAATATSGRPIALVVGLALGLLAVGVTVLPIGHRVVRVVVGGAGYVGALLAFLWLAVPGTVYPWFGAGILLVSVVVLAEVLQPGRLRRVSSGALARSPITVEVRRRVRTAGPVLPEGERGLWDFRRDGDRAMAAMTTIANEMSGAMDKQTKRMNRHSRRMGRAAEHGVEVERAYALSESAAKDLNAHATRMEELEARLREQRVSMIQNYTD